MKTKLFVLLIIVAVSCKNESNQAEKKIKQLEAADTSLTPAYLNKLKEDYISFYRNYPENSKSPEFLYKAAEKADYLDNHGESMSILDTLLIKYPNSEAARLALFKKGITYENMGQCEKAKQAYEQFLKKYPNDPLAKDIKLNLKNLCKGTEIFENVIVEDPDDEPPVK